MSNIQKPLKELDKLADVSAMFCNLAFANSKILAALNKNASEEEADNFRSLSDELVALQGPRSLSVFVPLDALNLKAKTEDDRKAEALKEIEFVELFTEIVSRTTPLEALSALVVDKSEELSQGFISVQAPNLAKLCI